MSELISGKEALDAWYEGLEIEVKHSSTGWFVFNEHNFGVTVFKSEDHQFRIKPHTIKLNDIEVPTPFKPRSGDMVWCLNELSEKGYEARTTYNSDDFTAHIAYWRSEDEIKQVVAALRSIFK